MAAVERSDVAHPPASRRSNRRFGDRARARVVALTVLRYIPPPVHKALDAPALSDDATPGALTMVQRATPYLEDRPA